MTRRTMKRYYSDVLSAERLRACYDVAPPRVRQYLEAETARVLQRIPPGAAIVELGCGYGRVLGRLSAKAGLTVGIDTSESSIRMARSCLSPRHNVRLAVMSALPMGFADGAFDATICIQNGISAFHVDQVALFEEALRITRTGGTVLFSSYSPSFWPHRLEWFEAQAANGLIGPIDHEATGNGVIVCKDGFHASTVGAERFREIASSLGQRPEIYEVDGSSLFCEVRVRRRGRESRAYS